MSPYPLSMSAARPALDRWSLRDPAASLEDLSRLLPLAPGLVVTLVHRPAQDQRLLAAVPLEWPWRDGDPDDVPDDGLGRARTRLLEQAAKRLWGRRSRERRPADHAFVTVVLRRGRVVEGREESTIRSAWRYANHVLPVLTGEQLLVTEYGWCSDDDNSCGAYPRLDIG